MRPKDYFKFTLAVAVICFAAVSCHPDTPDQPSVPTDEEALTRLYVNTFAYNVMNTYYLWTKEISDKLKAWLTTDEPIAKVKEIRYKDSSGNDIDKWTQVTDDFESFTSSVAGVSTTYGCSLSLYYTDATQKYVCAVVRYTSADSPARKAGLKRGDCIMSISGHVITAENYKDLLYDDFLYAPSCELTLSDGSTVKMTATKMYEDPVLLFKTFDCGGHKVGYLVYNSFTVDSWERLIEAGKYFRQQGIDELILDMRYNGGGYVWAEYTLASILAPQTAITLGSVFETAVYNEALTKQFGEEKFTFTDQFDFISGNKQYTYSTTEAHINIKKIYAIMTGNSASASESILTGLMPYMDVEIIGEQSYGKYCTGLMYGADNWYDDVKDQLETEKYDNGKKYAHNWGIYVMIGRYADKNGNTPCMPDGFKPDVEVRDNPTEPYELGDEREAMLRVVLRRAGKADLAPLGAASAAATRAGGDAFMLQSDFQIPFEGTTFTGRIMEPDQVKAQIVARF